MTHASVVLAVLVVAGVLPLNAQGNAAVDSAVAASLRGTVTREVKLIGPARPLGDGRYFAVAARARRTEGALTSVVACLATSAAGAWQVECVPVPTPRMDWFL